MPSAARWKIVVRSNKSKLLSSQPRQVRDPEATKAQILDAAESEFAKYGLNGARTEAIAARSGVTKAMIYYYFESKEGRTVSGSLTTPC